MKNIYDHRSDSPVISDAPWHCAIRFLLLSSLFIFIGGCGGRSFGFPECDTDNDCDVGKICSPNGFCQPGSRFTETEQTGSGSDTFDTNSSTVDSASDIVDSASDTADSESGTIDSASDIVDSDSDTADTDTETIDSASDTVDSDSDTMDTDTGTGTDGDCASICVSVWACESSYAGTIDWSSSCASFPNICCIPGTDSDSDTADTDSETEVDTDTALCTTAAPVCLEDQSGAYTSDGCCAASSVAAICSAGNWGCPNGYLAQNDCQNMAPDCPPSPPEGCGFFFPVFYPAGNNVSAIATGSVNNDDYPDVVAATASDHGFTVFLGNGDGSFSAAAPLPALGVNPIAIDMADMDGDGNEDVFVLFSEDSEVGIFLGNGDGTFENKISVSVYNSPVDMRIADINNDDVPDIVISSAVSSNPRIGVRTAKSNAQGWTGSFNNMAGTATGAGPGGLALMDFDRDGFLDGVVACSLANTVEVLMGNGTARFSDGVSLVAGDSPMFPTAADVDSDGNSDILVGNQFSDNISIWYGMGDGTFGERLDVPAGDGARAAVPTLFNSDSVADLVISNWRDDTLSLLFGTLETDTDPNGVLSFSGDNYFAGDSPTKPIVTDLNGDGVPDAIVGSRAMNAVGVLIGYCAE